MAVDVKRVQAVFIKAIEAADPAQQAAILDRECAADPELRRRVEALLAAHQDPPTFPEPGAQALPEPSGAMPSGGAGSADWTDPGETSGPVPVVTHVEPAEGAGPQLLDFLEPSTRPGALGRLGHYEVLEVLGRGGFGIVVRAFDEVLQRVVAIKVLAPQLAATSPARKRFLREARAAARVRHEYVVQIHAVEEQPLPYLVMEHVPGQTLQQQIDRTGPLEVADVLRIGEQVARGLAAAHAQGLIHRDIKPANILVERGVEQKVKLTDFGLARAADDASISQSGVVAGTPLYMAPEQARGETLDHRADLFSLGSVLYTMTSGRPPFRAASALAVLKRVAEDTPRPIREIIPEVPQWLCDLIARLHAKDPARRIQSAAEVADLLGRHLAHLQHPSLVPLPQAGAGPGRRRPIRVAILVAAAVVVVALAAALTYPLWRPGGPPGPGGRPPNGALRSFELQRRDAVRAALIDFDKPEHCFGATARDNAVRRTEEQCNAFLVRFDLAKLGVPPKAHVAKAMVSFYVWDPSSRGRTKVCAFALKTGWDEATVSWGRPAAGKSWGGGKGFAFDADTGPPGPAVIVEPDKEGTDTVDPPLEYQLEVTEMVRSWLDGRAPNHGLAIAPVIDRSVDKGESTRFQVCGSPHPQAQYTPKLTVQVRQ
jgi:hypothetical protein